MPYLVCAYKKILRTRKRTFSNVNLRNFKSILLYLTEEVEEL